VEIEPSLVSLDVNPIVTSAVGWLFNLTVKLAWPPASVVTSPFGVIVNPAVSSSTLVSETSSGSTPP